MLPLILVGRDKRGIDQFLQRFEQKHNFSPHFVFKIYPLKREFAIDQIRNIRRELVILGGKKRLYILFSFDTATQEAQNALLKTLEERSIDTQFILVVGNSESILPTVRSRGKVIYIERTSLDLTPEENTKTLIDKTIFSGNLTFLSDPAIIKPTRDELIDLFDKMIVYFHRKMKNEDYLAAYVLKKSLSLRYLVLNNNINPQLALDNLLIFVNKIYNNKPKGKKA